MWLEKVFNCATATEAYEDKAILVTAIQIIQNIIEVYHEEGDSSAHPTIVKLKEFIMSTDMENPEEASKIIKTLWNLIDEPGEQFTIV